MNLIIALLFVGASSAIALQTFSTNVTGDRIERWDSASNTFTTLVDLDAAFGPINYLPRGLALDATDIYWVDGQTDALYSSGINGSGPTQLNTFATAFQSIPNNTGVFAPAGVSLRGSTLFIADAAQAKILQIDTSGSTASAGVAVDMVTAFGGSALDYEPSAVFATGNAIFWTDDRTEKIYKSDTLGVSEIVDMTSLFGSGSYGLTGLTVSGSNLYWTDGGTTDDIYTSDLNGNGVVRLYDPGSDFPLANPEPTSIGVTGSTIYFSSVADDLFSVDLSGNNGQMLGQGPSERYVVFVPEPSMLALILGILVLGVGRFANRSQLR